MYICNGIHVSVEFTFQKKKKEDICRHYLVDISVGNYYTY